MHLESLCADIHNDFQWSPDLRGALMGICEVVGIKYTMPQNYISFRWLSIYDVAQDFSRMSTALILFYYSFISSSKRPDFLPTIIKIYKLYNVSETGRDYIRKLHLDLSMKNLTPAGRDRKNRIVGKLFDGLTKKLITNLYLSVLPLLQEYIKLFQSGKPLIHKLHDKQFELLKGFLACFVKPEVFRRIGNSAKKIMGVDISNKNYHLKDDLIFVGKKV